MDSLRRANPKRPPESLLVKRSSPPLTKKVPQAETLVSDKKEMPLFTKRPVRLRRFLVRFGLILVGVFIVLTFLLGARFLGTLSTMQLKSKDSPSFLSQINTLTQTFRDDSADHLKKTGDGRINILLLGRAGETYPGKNLTDTIMLASIDTERHKVGLISLPRDLYITLDDERVSAKINSLYQYGLNQNRGTEMIEKAVSRITGEPVHYTFILDFDGFEKIVDTFGGVNVEVMRDIHDERYPGKNYSYETFDIQKGWQSLDGKTALKYVRERHDDPEGDFGRAKRQQQVIAALKEKAFANSFLYNIDALLKLLSILGESVKTNATLAEMENFLALSRRVDTQNIETLVIDAWKKESLLRVSHVPMGGVNAFILLPRTGNWQETSEASQSIFSRELLLKRTQALLDEEATVTILYRPEDASIAVDMKNLLDDSLDKTVTLTPVRTYASWPEKSMLEDKTGLKKPWTLDTLIKKFDLEKADSLAFEDAQKSSSDFVIIIGTVSLNLPEEHLLEESSSSDTKEGEPLIIENK